MEESWRFLKDGNHVTTSLRFYHELREVKFFMINDM